MPSWLSGLVGLFTGTFHTLWGKVVSLVTTVYQWVDKGLTILRNDVTSVLGDVFRLADSVSSFVYNTYNTFVRWVDKTFSDVIKWASNEIATVEHYATDILTWATREFDSVNKWVTGLFDSIEKWVISDIWDPLYGSITGALAWIGHEGSFMYDLLTHPDKLVQLILAYVWSAWLDLFKQFAKPIVAYIVQNFKAVVPDLVSVMEDIITSIL